MGIAICQSESTHQDPAPCPKKDTLQFEKLKDIGISAMVQSCLDRVPKVEDGRRMNLAGRPNLSLIEMACQFQGSAVQVEQLLPTREHQNTGPIARSVIQRDRLRD
ncbi:MAG: hypothetical protein H8K03_05125 [Nitrospira sp.]